MPGATALRVRSRDVVPDVEVEWSYSADEMTTWNEWYRDTLLDGQMWFEAEAPGAGGWIDRALRFRTRSLRLELIGNGNFRVSARLQQRGHAVAPQAFSALMLLTFDEAVGTQVFNDRGYGRATWTANDAGVVLSDTHVVATRSLRLPSDTTRIEADYNDRIAVTDADFEIQFDVRPDSGARDGRDWLGIVGESGFTSSWLFYTGLVGGLFPNRMSFFWVDQGGAEYRVTSSVTLPTEQWSRIKAKRAASDITIWQDGILRGTYTGFTGGIRTSIDLNLVVGKSSLGESTGKASYYDNIVVVSGPGTADSFLS